MSNVMSENRPASRQAAPRAFADLVGRRTSCRAYKTDAVPREYIEEMIEAARWAPSACNRQPWRFAVVTFAGTRKRLIAEGLLPGLKASWIDQAPVMIALGIERDVLTHRLAPWISGIDYPAVDLGIAGEHLVLRATELGLGTCWIGWIRKRGVRRVVGWPRRIDPVALIAVGWPADATHTAARRERKPTAAIAMWIER